MRFEKGKGYKICPVGGEIFEYDTFGATGPAEYMCSEHRAILEDIENPMEKRTDVHNKMVIIDQTKQITELEAQLAEYRKPMEAMDTEQLTDWNAKLTELLYAPDSEREYLPWQIAVGDHLEKFAKSWHSSRIAELEAEVKRLSGQPDQQSICAVNIEKS